MIGRVSRAGQIRRLATVAVAVILAAAAMGVSCDENAQAVFRQSATNNIGEGVKQFLGGDTETGVNTIVTATIDGLVDSIVAAGDGPPAAK